MEVTIVSTSSSPVVATRVSIRRGEEAVDVN
jgi:hypothetical protein